MMQMQPDFEKANEIYFRLGIIYKQQQKFGQSLECFKYIVNSPPPPLTEEDIWFQIGHVHEQQKDVSFTRIYIVLLNYTDFLRSTIVLRLHMVVCLIVIQTMPRCCNNLAGSTTSKAVASRARSELLNIWKNPSQLVSI